MIPIEFKEQNKIFHKPADMTDEECQSLNVWQGKDQAGFPNIISCWKLTEEELKTVNETGVVWLTIVGNGMPPVSVSGIYPFVELK